jgi:hypothetical protein
MERIVFVLNVLQKWTHKHVQIKLYEISLRWRVLEIADFVLILSSWNCFFVLFVFLWLYILYAYV